jgi:restriction endonuclease Mrr
MKRPSKKLLEDLLEDSVSLEFRAALMNKTLQSARQRKYARRLSLTLSALALAGIFAFTIREKRQPKTALNQIQQPISSVAVASSLNPVQVVSTKLHSLKNVAVSDSSDSTLTVVQTSESDRPKEISDKELLVLVADKSVALIHQGLHQSELIFLNPKEENELPVQ